MTSDVLKIIFIHLPPGKSTTNQTEKTNQNKKNKQNKTKTTNSKPPKLLILQVFYVVFLAWANFLGLLRSNCWTILVYTKQMNKKSIALTPSQHLQCLEMKHEDETTCKRSYKYFLLSFCTLLFFSATGVQKNISPPSEIKAVCNSSSQVDQSKPDSFRPFNTPVLQSVFRIGYIIDSWLGSFHCNPWVSLKLYNQNYKSKTKYWLGRQNSVSAALMNFIKASWKLSSPYIFQILDVPDCTAVWFGMHKHSFHDGLHL